MEATRFAALKEGDFLPGQLGEEEADVYCRLYCEDDLDLADNIDRTHLPLWPAAVVCAAVVAAAVWVMG